MLISQHVIMSNLVSSNDGGEGGFEFLFLEDNRRLIRGLGKRRRKEGTSLFCLRGEGHQKQPAALPENN